MKKVGRFTVNEKLTKKLAVENWVIYRDPSVGLYAYNEKENEEFCTGHFSASQIEDIDSFISSVRIDIAEKERDIEEMKDFNPNAVFTCRA